MNKLLTLLTMTSLLASPAVGSVKDAAFASSSDRHGAQTSMFAGATYSVALDRRTHEKRERASLKFAGMSHVPGSSEIRFGDGLELTSGRTGRPALHIAGQDVGQLNAKAQLSGTGTALIIGGVIVVGVVVALVASDLHHDNKCSEEEDCD